MAADRDTRSRPATTAPRELPRPAGGGSGYRICVVCLGNICRSPTAEVVLREELDRAGLGGRVTVESAGTGDWHIGGPMDSGARAELARRGYDGSAHVARQITADWRGAYDLFVVMDRMNLLGLRGVDAKWTAFPSGPAINEVARIEALCQPLGRAVLVSAEFVEGLKGADSPLLGAAVGEKPVATSLMQVALRPNRRDRHG